MRTLFKKMFGLEKEFLGILGLLVSTQTDDLFAQNFLDPIQDPYGLKYDTILFAIDADFVDIDDDGDLDFFSFGRLADDYYTVRYLYQENIGSAETPEFAASQIDPFGEIDAPPIDSPTGAELVDIDGDGDFDVIMPKVYDGYYIRGIDIYENVGTKEIPSFQGSQSVEFDAVSEDHQVFDIELIDLDLDGDLDLLSSSRTYDYQSEDYVQNFLYVENTSDENGLSFGPIVLNPFGLSSMQEDQFFFFMDLADLDMDNDLDILTSTVQGGIFSGFTTQYFWYENIGSSQEPEFMSPLSNPFNLPGEGDFLHIPEFVDLDSDGDMDLFISNYLEESETFEYLLLENDEMTSTQKKSKLTPSSIKIYPNPTSEFLFIDFPSGMRMKSGSIRIYNTVGITFYEKDIELVPNSPILIHNWHRGMYFLSIKVDGKQITKKFLKD